MFLTNFAKSYQNEEDKIGHSILRNQLQDQIKK